MSHKTIAWEKWEEPVQPSVDTSALFSPQAESFEDTGDVADGDF